MPTQPPREKVISSRAELIIKTGRRSIILYLRSMGAKNRARLMGRIKPMYPASLFGEPMVPPTRLTVPAPALISRKDCSASPNRANPRCPPVNFWANPTAACRTRVDNKTDITKYMVLRSLILLAI